MKYYGDEDAHVSWTWKAHEVFFVKDLSKENTILYNSKNNT